jgi:hypothetical protein
MTEEFIKKLMISKQIMDKHVEIPRGQSGGVPNNISEMSEQRISSPDLYSPEPINANYNIPQEFLSNQTVQSAKPIVVTEDRIKNSKLPDAIKELMLKHPIKQPESYSPSLSNDIIEKAARLMGENKINNQSAVKSAAKDTTGNLMGDIRKIIREELENIFNENGLISESESKSNEIFQFKVGKHIFEGKITKIRKIS